MHQVMMVVPVNAEVHEAQYIAEEDRDQWLQCRNLGSVRHLHLQHHDGDDDGQDSVTKRF